MLNSYPAAFVRKRENRKGPFAHHSAHRPNTISKYYIYIYRKKQQLDQLKFQKAPSDRCLMVLISLARGCPANTIG